MLIKHGVACHWLSQAKNTGCGCILTLPMPEVPSFVQSSVPCWTALRYILDNNDDNNTDNNNNNSYSAILCQHLRGRGAGITVDHSMLLFVPL